MATALASVFTNTPVRRDIAMTGEITLRGRVLPIGGLKEKILAARRAGLKTVIIPHRNEKDLEEVPKHVRRGMEFILAETMDDVIPAALKRPSSSKSRRPGTRKIRRDKIMMPAISARKRS